MLKKIRDYIDRKRLEMKSGRTGWKQILAWIIFAVAGIFVIGVVAMVVLIAVVSIGLPDVHDLDKLNVSQSTTIYDREGNILYVKHGGENREYVAFESISKNLIDATVAIEDDQFWLHQGFDPIGIGRAFINNIFHFSAQQGGSTITQQYIKNTFLSSEKSYIRKLKELILSIQLEQAYDKQKILELYLNKIPYGNNAYGIEKAAQVYFNKHAKDLDLAQSAILASIPKAPSYYNPFGPHLYSELSQTFTPEELAWRKITAESDLADNEFLRGLIGKTIRIDDTHIVYVQGRTDLVLKSMVKLGYISEEQKKEALINLQNIVFSEYREPIKHPHFVFRILAELEEKYGKEIVEQGGLKVYTTLDPVMQEAAETAVTEGAAANEEKYNAKNAALVAIDPKTGEILAMVGSRDYFDKEIDGAVNVAEQFRQPGSSFKPFVYAQAFYNRYAPGSIVFDTETRFGASAFPKNFDGKFWGPMPIRKALGQSRNIPAIKAYFLAGEQEPIKQLAERMGIVFMDRNLDYGWPLALGAAEVRLTDMVSAFGVFANGGVRHSPVDIIKVESAAGEILEEYKPEESKGQEVLDPQIAYLITSILSDTGVRLSENMTVPGHVNAAKTGTSNRKVKGTYYPHDLWCMGYTKSLAAGVWTGNNRDEEGNISIYADGVNVAAPIWKRFMTEALKNRPSESFPVPEGIREVTISSMTGLLPGPNTPADQQKSEVFASFSVPTEVDNSYAKVEVDSRNNKLSNQYCPPDFVKEVSFVNIRDIMPDPEWEKGAQAWLQSHAGEFSPENAGIIYGAPPVTESELCTLESYNSKPEIEITSPEPSEKIPTGANVTVTVRVNAQNGTDKVEYYLDDQLKYTADASPFSGVIRLPKGETGTRRHVIKAIAFDKYGYTGETTVEIIVTDSFEEEAPVIESSPSPTPPPADTSPPSSPPGRANGHSNEPTI